MHCRQSALIKKFQGIGLKTQECPDSTELESGQFWTFLGFSQCPLYTGQNVAADSRSTEDSTLLRLFTVGVRRGSLVFQ